MDLLDPLFGLANVSMGQSVQLQQVFYQSKTVAETLATAGGQIVAIIGISQFFLMSYQQFSYDKNALKLLYYEEDQHQTGSSD